MGRIGQSLIMPGQPPYCSLFSVCRVDDGRRRVLVRGVGARACVCVHKHAPCETGQVYGREKGPHLISSSNLPASRLCLSKLDFILQKQSGMNNSFSSPSFCFFRLSFPFSYPLFLVFLSCSSLSLSFFFPPPPFLFSFLPSFCSSSWHCGYCFVFSLSLEIPGRFCPRLAALCGGRVCFNPCCVCH